MKKITLIKENKKAVTPFQPKTISDGLFLKCSDLENAVAGIFTYKTIKKDSLLGPYIGVQSSKIEGIDSLLSWHVSSN